MEALGLFGLLMVHTFIQCILEGSISLEYLLYISDGNITPASTTHNNY